MTQIPFTTKHEDLLNTCVQKLGEHATTLGEHGTKIDALDKKVDALDKKVDALDKKVDDMNFKFEAKIDALDKKFDEKFELGFRRANMMHEELVSKMNVIIEVFEYNNKKLAQQELVNAKVDDHEIRLDIIESFLKRDA